MVEEHSDYSSDEPDWSPRTIVGGNCFEMTDCIAHEPDSPLSTSPLDRRSPLYLKLRDACFQFCHAPLTVLSVVGEDGWLHASLLGVGKVQAVKEDCSPCAGVISGVTFRLHDPEPTLARLREQITKLKEFAR